MGRSRHRFCQTCVSEAMLRVTVFVCMYLFQRVWVIDRIELP